MERACAGLAILVRGEYPPDLTLAEIAQTWGDGVSQEQIEALGLFEAEWRNDAQPQ